MGSKNEKNQSVDSTIFPSEISRYIEPATIVTLLACALYFIGWFYLEGYFNRLGIHQDSLELPVIFYFRKAILPVLTFTGLFYWMVLGVKKDIKTRLDAFLGNIPLFLLAFFFMYYLITGYNQKNSVLILLTFLGFIIMFIEAIVLSWRKSSFSHMLLKKPLNRIIFYFILLMIASIGAGVIGDIHATKTIEGTLATSSSINYTWIGDLPAELEGKELVLILYYQERYYVTVRQNPAPKYPNIYIIPDDQIALATIKRIG